MNAPIASGLPERPWPERPDQSSLFGFERINYLMLMMVDPDVHFHVLPRYGSARTFAGVTFEDAGWPGPPRLDVVNAGAAAVITDLVDEVKSCWPAGAA